MSCWILPEHVLVNSPSRADRISVEEERTYRRRTAIFIDEAGGILKFPRLTIATAQVFCHRFYALQSFRRHKRFNVAVTCLFLAGKVEESFKNLQHVIVTCFRLWNRKKKVSSSMTEGSQEYEDLRLQILKCERVLLHTIAFDLCVEHPYKFLIDSVKAVHQSGLITDELKKDFAQKAVNFLNDSMRTSLCLQFEPQKIASAAIYMAMAYLDVELPASEPSKWTELVELDGEELKLICSQMMQVYSYHVTEHHDTRMRDLGARLAARDVIPRSLLEPPKRQLAETGETSTAKRIKQETPR